MKITQLAIGGILILLVTAGYLMMDSANDKKFSQLQDRQNQLLEQISKMKQPPAAAVAAPAAAEVPPASTEVAVAAKDSTAKHPPAATPKGPGPKSASTDVILPNPATDLKLAEDEKKILETGIKQLDARNLPTGELNPLQVKIMNLPVVAKIKSFNEKLGFVELDAGKNRKLEKGMIFDVRREAVLVGKVVISDTIEEASSIADVDPKSVPVGVILKQGDELVLFN